MLNRIRFYNRKETVKAYKAKKKHILKRFPNGSLSHVENRRGVIQEFTNEFKHRHGRYPHVRDFENAGLTSIINHYCKGSPLRAYKDAGYADPTKPNYDDRLVYEPWNALDELPDRFWHNAQNRNCAIHWLVKKTRNEKGRYPSTKDFTKAGLGSILQKGSILELLEDAGYTDPTSLYFDPLLDYAPWIVLPKMPNGYWNDEQNCAIATRWAVWASGKRPKNVNKNDFLEFGLGMILNGRSLYSVLSEAGFNVEPDEMYRVPRNYWKSHKNRIEAIQKFAKGKDPMKIRYDDICKASLGRILCYASKNETLQDAGLLPA